MKTILQLVQEHIAKQAELVGDPTKFHVNAHDALERRQRPLRTGPRACHAHRALREGAHAGSPDDSPGNENLDRPERHRAGDPGLGGHPQGV